MVLVRIKDKRHNNGYRIKFFKTDTITEEVIQFVKSNPKAYWIAGDNEIYHSREEFLKADLAAIRGEREEEYEIYQVQQPKQKKKQKEIKQIRSGHYSS